jgi:hypothetical protein
MIDDEARYDSARFAVDFAPSTSPVGALATIPLAFNDPDLWSPGSAIRFHSDGSLTGTGTVTVRLPVLPSRTAGPVAVIDLQRMLDSEQSELDPYCFARNPLFNRPFGICARVRVLNVPVYDTPASHPRLVSGTIFISGDSIIEGR